MKKLLSGALALALCASLTGCGSAAGDGEDKTLTIGASVTPHAEIINNIKPDLEEMGYTVEIVEFSDYVKPNDGPGTTANWMPTTSSTISIWQSGMRRTERIWYLPVISILSRWESIPIRSLLWTNWKTVSI